MKEKLHHLAQEIEGQLYDDKLWRSIYATDASVYREMPLAVCYPKNENDLKKLIKFAKAQKTSTKFSKLHGYNKISDIMVDLNPLTGKLYLETRWII